MQVLNTPATKKDLIDLEKRIDNKMDKRFREQNKFMFQHFVTKVDHAYHRERIERLEESNKVWNDVKDIVIQNNRLLNEILIELQLHKGKINENTARIRRLEAKVF